MLNCFYFFWKRNFFGWGVKVCLLHIYKFHSPTFHYSSDAYTMQFIISHRMSHFCNLHANFASLDFTIYFFPCAAQMTVCWKARFDYIYKHFSSPCVVPSMWAIRLIERLQKNKKKLFILLFAQWNWLQFSSSFVNVMRTFYLKLNAEKFFLFFICFSFFLLDAQFVRW